MAGRLSASQAGVVPAPRGLTAAQAESTASQARPSTW